MNHKLAEADWLRTQRIRRATHRGHSATQPLAPTQFPSVPCCSFTEQARSTRAPQRTQALYLSPYLAPPNLAPPTRNASSSDSSRAASWVDEALLDMVVVHLSQQQLFCLPAQTLARYDLLLLEFAPAQLASALTLLVHLRRATQAPVVVLGDFTCADDRAELLLAGADSVLSPDAQPAVLAGYCRALLRRWVPC